MKKNRKIIDVTAADVFSNRDREILCYILAHVPDYVADEIGKRYGKTPEGVSQMISKIYWGLIDEEEKDEH